MMNWSEPLPLSDYLRAPKVLGLYIIGAPDEDGKLPTSSFLDDAYLGFNFPDHMTAEYVGISEDTRSGVRGRLSKHARKVGNKGIAKLLSQGRTLYFITCAEDILAASHESVMLCLKGQGQLECNVRLEYKRNQSRMHERIHLKYGGEPFTATPRTWEGDGM